MVCTINLKAIMRTNVRTGCIIIWTILVITSAHTEKKYETVRDQENFDTFNSSHTIILGHRQDGDRLLMWHHAADCGKILRKVSEVIEFKGTGFGAIIYLINLTNLDENKEGTAMITAGGVGHTFVNIYVSSTRRGGGYNYFVQVFGEAKTIDDFDFRAFATENNLQLLLD